MGKIAYTDGTGVPHRGFEDEFLTHRKCSEWWYATGYLEDEAKNLYSFQFTLAQIRIAGIKFHMLLTALTDIGAGKHYYAQHQDVSGRRVTSDLSETAFGGIAGIRYSRNEKSAFGDMELSMKAKEYELNLAMRAQKPPVWHCEDGRLQMGILDDPRQVTYYYSMTNLSVEGMFILDGKTRAVKGKAWFDRQGGTCRLTNPLTNWEWFSLRFFDGEEVMLFSFPRTGYADGTYVRADGTYRRLNDYGIEPLGFFTEPGTGYRFSNGWRVRLAGVREEEYLVRPAT
ncbi:MAG: carotenoid 1,2-hydratase, partial [Clostridiales bacterium]|nr:carotenoid 1,2-hydratase [Clostridiales bacterium]